MCVIRLPVRHDELIDDDDGDGIWVMCLFPMFAPLHNVTSAEHVHGDYRTRTNDGRQIGSSIVLITSGSNCRLTNQAQ